MTNRVVVLGAGFAGLELATLLSQRFGDALDLVLIDDSPGFVFGFSKLDVAFGRADADHVLHPYAGLHLPGVRFVAATVEAIDAPQRAVRTSQGEFTADHLVIALGADLDPAATPGLLEHGHDFYTERSAFDLAATLDAFGGGDVVVGVTGTPFKCPPAPSETALLVHDHLVARGLRETSTVTLVMPFGVPIPPSPDASRALLAAFAERGIRWVGDTTVTAVRAGAVDLSDGGSLPADLALIVPRHRVPEVVEASGLTTDGWIPVDPFTLETQWPGVYALGDVTSVGTPKAGVFSEGQAVVAARRIGDLLAGQEPTDVYDGHGLCYLEFGHDQVAKVDVTFAAGQAPTGEMQGPSTDLIADKAEFGRTRIARWFGRDWIPVPPA